MFQLRQERGQCITAIEQPDEAQLLRFACSPLRKKADRQPSPAAVAAKAFRSGVDASEVLLATARLAMPAAEGDSAQARRMVSLLVDGLRFGATV